MSAVVKKSLLCCLNKKRLYLGAVKLPLSSGWRQWLLGPWAPCGAFPQGAGLGLGEVHVVTGHGVLLDGRAGWSGEGLQPALGLFSLWRVQMPHAARSWSTSWPGEVVGLWLEGTPWKAHGLSR